MALPFDLVPTASLLPRSVTHSEPSPPIHKTQDKKSATPISSISSTKRELKSLDEELGMRILEFIYKKRQGALNLEKVPSQKTYTASSSTKTSTHKPTFYMGEENGSTKKQSAGAQGLDLIDKMTDSLGISSKAKVKFITTESLLANKVTIENLVRDCRVGITDLWGAGIVDSVEKLMALGFKMKDLVINVELFSVSHLVNFFKLYYKQLREMKGIEFSVIDLFECQFHANELLTLHFSFDDMIQKKGINKTQLLALQFSLVDLATLGFKKEHLKTLQISREEALKNFKWTKKEYNDFVS